MKNAVIYARYSSDKQTEQSIDGQVRDCTTYANAKELAIIDIYIDRALSGTADNRPAFQQMLKDSTNGRFTDIIIYKTDRFARNRYDSAKYKAQLKKNGVKLHYAKEHIPDGIEGILMESLLEGMAEYYSAELSQKVKRGMRENLLKGKYVGGVVPLGFKISEDKNYAVDDSTAPIVRTIFKMKTSGNTNAEIIEYLNNLGLRSSKGYKYNKNSFRSILKNKKYIGILEYQGEVVYTKLPKIIDEQTFEEVQQIMENKKYKRNNKINYLLSGKAVCGECGEILVGVSGKSKSGKMYGYYKPKCNCKTVDTLNKVVLEQYIAEQVKEHLLTDDKIQIIAKKVEDIYNDDKAHLDTLNMLNNKKRILQKQLEGLLVSLSIKPDNVSILNKVDEFERI